MFAYILARMETGLALVCLRFGHSWLRRSLARIQGICPQCRSLYWNHPERERSYRRFTLAAIDADESPAETIGDWHYRANPGYCF
jgi:hypothetical protein